MFDVHKINTLKVIVAIVTIGCALGILLYTFSAKPAYATLAEITTEQ